MICSHKQGRLWGPYLLVRAWDDALKPDKIRLPKAGPKYVWYQREGNVIIEIGRLKDTRSVGLTRRYCYPTY